MSLLHIKIPYALAMNFAKKDKKGDPLVRYKGDFWIVRNVHVSVDKATSEVVVSFSVDPFGDALIEDVSFRQKLRPGTKTVELPWGARYDVEM